jgi:hypothetical protein
VDSLQDLLCNRFVTYRDHKKKVGYFLPQEVIDAMEKVRARTVAKREKWLVVSAAFAMFLHASADEQDLYVALAQIANGPKGSFESLLKMKPERAKNHLNLVTRRGTVSVPAQ